WEAVPVLPHASVTVQDLVTVRVQPLPCSAPTVPVATSPLLQLSVTVAAPKAAAICAAVGLHGMAEAAASVITGFSVSRVNVTVWVAVPVLPQASVTVQDLVTVRVQPLPCSAPTEPLATRPLLQLSVTVAAPKAAAICATVGLH